MRASWLKQTLNGDTALDISLPKYEGTSIAPNECILLIIRDCDETDIGTYFLQTVCSGDKEISSDKLNIAIFEGKLCFLKICIKHF